MLHKVFLINVLWCVFVICEIDPLSNDNDFISEKESGETLNLSNMGIMHLKNTFFNSSTVTHLDLSKNNIWKIEKGVFDSLPNLKYLNLMENVFPFKTLLANNLSNVETLILDKAIILEDQSTYSEHYREYSAYYYDNDDL
ncbi:Protein of unknown function [Cotesia congregata]|uniref:Uncharacterized protein n=1 Tax=Cotesia congregata TaxID=51543 RepID=A0A8J2MYY1_COTCN|nr:Protein of unknown function [Cotesia congregata]